MFGLSFYFGLTVTVLLLIGMHWFPWPRKLHRLETYQLGLSAILIGQLVWLGCVGNDVIEESGWTVYLVLVGWVVVSGAVVKGTYAIDDILRNRAEAKWRRLKNGCDE